MKKWKNSDNLGGGIFLTHTVVRSSLAWRLCSDDDVRRLRNSADVRDTVHRVNNDSIFSASNQPRQINAVNRHTDNYTSYRPRLLEHYSRPLSLHVGSTTIINHKINPLTHAVAHCCHMGVHMKCSKFEICGLWHPDTLTLSPER